MMMRMMPQPQKALAIVLGVVFALWVDIVACVDWGSACIGTTKAQCTTAFARDSSLIATRAIVSKRTSSDIEYNHGVRTTRRFDESLASMEALVLKNAMRASADPDYNLSAEVRAALTVIQQQITMIKADVVKQHEAAQRDLDDAFDLIGGCVAEVEGSLGVDALRMKADKARENHTACRSMQASARSAQVTDCGEFESKARAPRSCSLAETAEGFDDCLEDHRTWTTEIASSFKDCRDASSAHTRLRSECDDQQTVFESNFCQYAARSADSCSCHGRMVEHYLRQSANAKTLEVDRKADFEAASRIDCLLDVINFTDRNSSVTKSGLLETCQNATFDASSLTIVYGSVPAQAVSCNATEVRPCSSEWLATEYEDKAWSVAAPAKTCTPCPTTDPPKTTTTTTTTSGPPSAPCELLAPQAFDGKTAIPLPDTCQASGNEARTVMVWIKNEGAPNGWTIFHQGGRQGVYDRGQVWGVRPLGPHHIWGHSNDIDFEKQLVFGSEAWHHFGVTWDGTNYAVYYDGSVVQSGTHEKAFATSGGAFYGGAGPGIGHYFTGEASDLRYWSKALSAEEVAYYAGLPRTAA